MHQNNKFVLAVPSFSYQNRLKQHFKHMFGRINELLIVSVFKDHILLIFMQKMGLGKQVRIIEVQLYLTSFIYLPQFCITIFSNDSLGYYSCPKRN